MPVLNIDAVDDRPVLHGSGDLDAALNRALALLPPGAPVVILIHGYKFAPGRAGACPHDHILSLNPDPALPRAVSWPRHMGFGRGSNAEGLCIAFGWSARGSIWRAWQQAPRAGLALADLVGRVRRHRPGAVDLLTHSLGARVALAALADLPENSIGRAVLMMAAEFQSTAAAALDSPAGRTAEIVNITSRENDLFDALAELALRAPAAGDRTLGAGLGGTARNWLDVQLDCPASRRALAEFGYRIPPPARRICHWSAYLRPGLFGFYRDLIRQRHTLPLACLRHVLPDRATPRWSLLWPDLRLRWRHAGARTRCDQG